MLDHVEKECDVNIWKADVPQFGDWMRATLAKKRDQRSRSSDGSSMGGSLQQKTSESLRREEPARRSIQFEDGRKGKGGEDNEVRDDGSSPLKLMPNVSTAAVIPKKTIF